MTEVWINRILRCTLATLAALTLACARERPAHEGTRRMAARLDEIATEIRRDGSAFLPEEQVAILRSIPPPTDQRSRLKLTVDLARAELYAGETEAAVATLGRALPEIEAAKGLFKPEFLRELERLHAIAWLRLGEQQNCVDFHNVESCLLPIATGGVHQKKDGARRAQELYRAILQKDPDDLEARWLLNLAAMVGGDHPSGVPSEFLIPRALLDAEAEAPRFRDIAPRLGVAVLSLSGGVVADDLDRDGDIDLLVSAWGFDDPLRLFLNDGRAGFVEKPAEASGLAGIEGGLNLIHADYDNDSDLDVLVLRGAWLGEQGRFPSSLLRNRGDATFDDVTEETGLLFFHPTQTATWGDFDRDGWVDLYVGREALPGDAGTALLFRNRGDGTFEDVTAKAKAAVGGFIKAVVFVDVDNDLYPDLSVSRLNRENVLLMNQGDGTFADISDKAGVEAPVHSFPIVPLDFDNDGFLDLFCSGFSGSYGAIRVAPAVAELLGLPTEVDKARLFRNRGDGTFADVSAAMGLERVLFAMGANTGDFDNDGWPDLYLGTGAPDYQVLVPNRAFRNDGGRRFLDVTSSAGLGHLQKGHGIAFADFDRDGDQDIYAVMGGAFSGDRAWNVLFENPGTLGHHFVSLELEGRRSNRAAIGARLALEVEENGARRRIHAVVSSGGSFGASSLAQEIGLGRATRIERLEILWPSGEKQVFVELEGDAFYRVVEGDPQTERLIRPAFILVGSEPGHVGH